MNTYSLILRGIESIQFPKKMDRNVRALVRRLCASVYFTQFVKIRCFGILWRKQNMTRGRFWSLSGITAALGCYVPQIMEVWQCSPKYGAAFLDILEDKTSSSILRKEMTWKWRRGIMEGKGKYWKCVRDGVLEVTALDSRRLKDNSSWHVLGLERRVLDLGVGGQVLGLRYKALGLDAFSLVCLIFMLIVLVLCMYRLIWLRRQQICVS